MQQIAIISGKGGVGKSTVSTCLAQALAEEQKKVLLIDCDIGLRSLDLILGVDEHVLFTWADVALGRCKLEQAVMAYSESLHLLCAPLQHEAKLEEPALQEILTSCTRYDLVLIDAPAGIGFGFRAALRAANRCLVVTTPDPICVRSAAVAARQAMSFEQCKEIRLVINRFDRKQALRGMSLMIDDVIDQTEVQLIGVIPQETRLFLQTANGAPLQSGVVRDAVRRVAKRLLGENIELKLPYSS